MARAKSEPETTSKLGLFGGMFDPVHFGHLLSAQLTAEELDLDRVLFVPAGIPPHRSQPATEGILRLEMLRLAVEDNPLFKACDKEIQKDSPAYTVETIEELKEELPGVEIFLLVGSDELAEFHRWHRWEDILGLVRLVGINRPGTTLDNVNKKILDNCRLIDIPGLDISSSQLRRRRKNRRSLRYQLPGRVRKFIFDRNLYVGN